MGKKTSNRRRIEDRRRSEVVHVKPRRDESIDPHETDILVVRPHKGHEVDQSDESEHDEFRDVE